MSYLNEKVIELLRCPHCNVDKPFLACLMKPFPTLNHKKENERFWGIYVCANCGGIVLAMAHRNDGYIQRFWPTDETLSKDIPTRARTFLEQAINSVHSPSASIMVAASSVDAMLKEKGYKQGTLKQRIDKATEDHLITQEMAEWAHDVRLDANDERHADYQAPLPNETDAKRVIDFTQALAEFLFVLPAKVRRGRKQEPSP